MVSRLSPEIQDRSVTVTNTVGGTECLIPNPRRRGLLMQNVSTANIGICIDSGTPVIGTKGTISLAPGASFAAEDPICPLNGFKAIADAATADLAIWEIE